MSLPATDSFNTAFAQQLTDYSPNWTNVTGSFQVPVTDDVHSREFNVEAMARWNADVPNANQYSQIKITALGDGPGYAIGVTCRLSSSSPTCYEYYGTSTASYMYAWVAGIYDQLGSSGVAYITGSTYRLECNGTDIKPLKNGIMADIGNQTDSSVSSANYLGLGGYSNGSATRGDDWEGGNLSETTYKPQVTINIIQSERVRQIAYLGV